MGKIHEVSSATMEVQSYDEKGNLHCKALAKIDREHRALYHHFRVPPFQENLRLLKPGRYVNVIIQIMED